MAVYIESGKPKFIFDDIPVNNNNKPITISYDDFSREQFLVAKSLDGMLAGFCGISMTYPLDLSKTRLQNQVITPGQPPLYRHLFHTVSSVFQNEGFRGAYSGYLTNVSIMVFEASFKLVANDLIRSRLTDPDTKQITIFNECLTGAATGLLQSLTITPRELLKIKGQEAYTRGETFSLAKTVKEIYRVNGARGFYRGWAATVARDIPYAVIYFPLYAHLRDSDQFHNGREFKYNFAAGFLAGIVAAGASCPFDVVKTRLQNMPPNQRSSWMRCGGKAWHNEGQYRAFFKGVIPRMICIGSLFATAQAFYELKFGGKLVTMF